MSTHLLPTPLVGRYTAGMPQLCCSGLSENWLLKECGHRHWLAIAHSQGLAQPEFRDAQGHKVYAAFSLVRIQQAQLERVEEHDTFSISTQCQPAGRTQHYSQHAVELHGQCIARVEMLSVFVRRAQAGSNRSIVRAVMAGPSAVTQPGLAAATEAFVQRGRTRRAAAHTPAAADADTSVYTPCPYNDFNGADLLYFSSFQSMVDRAEWAGLHSTRPARLRERELVFYGNLDIGDCVHTQLQRDAGPEGLLAHHSLLRRGSDGVCIAEIFTRKQPAQQKLALAA
ncbi:probable biosynthetic protein, Pnap_2097 family [Rhodoferax sp. OV413]|uniref:Pnap_2097 family protein n=1 Tax=Rhodoferax sp. OV413 TaxID=1855285 RepID=UPI00088D35BA|nr:Pnap_2097 family protein [Rhodoferax sp. OV413]SDP40153.1 probable biosynthetic protein, Pnap_2097 family [Rhodoferax sp. OV413]